MNVCSKNDCTGCGICSIVCPVNAIKMRTDVLGFLYPSIDEALCKSCGLCESMCHVLSPQNASSGKTKKPLIYAGWHKTQDIRMNSTSGGAFTAFAEEVIRQDGCVVGAAYDDDYNVYHTVAHQIDDLEKLRGSKYVQSSMHQIISEIQGYLEKGKTVLFTGTPCQVAAISKFFSRRKWNGQLLTIDIVCHGVGSPVVFQKYLDEVITQRNSNKPIEFRFRDKEKSWRNPSVCAVYEDGRQYRMNGLIDPMFVGFNRDVFLRESCYQCRYTKLERISDITISDFWGYIGDEEFPDDDRGISMIMINTEKGRFLFEAAQHSLTTVQQTVDDAMRGQACLQRPTVRPVSRTEFENEISTPFIDLQKKYFLPWWNYSSYFFYRASHNRNQSSRKMTKAFFKYLDAITLRLKVRSEVNKRIFGNRSRKDT